MVPLGNRQPTECWRYYLKVAGMGLLAIAAGCEIESANVDKDPAELGRGTPETTELEMVDVEVELPIESIRLSRDRLTLSESLQVTAVVVLPDLCHQLIRLEGKVDGGDLRVTLRAWGSRQGEVCAQVLGQQDEILQLDPFANAGLWTVVARFYGESIKVEFEVTE